MLDLCVALAISVDRGMLLVTREIPRAVDLEQRGFGKVPPFESRAAARQTTTRPASPSPGGPRFERPARLPRIRPFAFGATIDAFRRIHDARAEQYIDRSQAFSNLRFPGPTAKRLAIPNLPVCSSVARLRARCYPAAELECAPACMRLREIMARKACSSADQAPRPRAVVMSGAQRLTTSWRARIRTRST